MWTKATILFMIVAFSTGNEVLRCDTMFQGTYSFSTKDELTDVLLRDQRLREYLLSQNVMGKIITTTISTSETNPPLWTINPDFTTATSDIDPTRTIPNTASNFETISFPAKITSALKTTLTTAKTTSAFFPAGTTAGLGTIATPATSTSDWETTPAPTNAIPHSETTSASAMTSSDLETNPTRPGLPADWESWNKTISYEVFNQYKTYADAEKTCGKYGAKLAAAIVRNMDRYEWNAVLKPYQKYWIGLDDRATEGSFVWSDDALYDREKTPWRLYQPNNRGNQDCSEIKNDGLLNDKTCHALRFFVCERREDD